MDSTDNNLENNISDVQPTPEPTTTNSSSLEDLFKQLSDAQENANKYKNEYLRAIADLDNYRRRAIREKEEMRKTAAMNIIEAMLPALDNLKLAVDASKDATNTPLFIGVKMVLEQMQAILSDAGLKTLNPKFEQFDPNTQECVAHIPSVEVPENTIIEVTRVGYMINDRLLRPASVVVSSGQSQTQM